uniref:EF-hand domain-containing protein n=1 Tax=Haptolina brevifila TaxID=156173 RepID=A0A7S2FQG4_9EUKA|mmetsp:Transcript_16168/g.32454  ORF Transcript_16168/g.32454 Transcript_16168/m.32454 type:complete len:213 (+) Transcript_16168:79-717(+)|eukprot:CAMPEP_0174723646 /NCGR_PEP_ID=MMETSP1094-20130205/41512_1 /TAXON_ID=156173 /ORGANISM="Chrysochromulina brevifilum, Strain UTEX LB 985" /LENGTH=212 /DNA_ID=CAMNT_0015924731 /DNA_START=79 /DNA_END=717 /DNA_ORIENTATION=+
MAPKMTASTGKTASQKGPLKTSKISTSQPRASISNRYTEAKWHVSEYKPQRKITDEELNAARQIFFSLDCDASGSIDAEELGVMLRSLGQNPTEAELKELIDSVDDGDKDGKIQLREFLKLYTQGLDNKTKGSREDVDDVFRAIQEHTEGDTCGAPAPRKDSIAKDYLSQLLKNEFELDVETALIDDILSCSKGSELARDEMATFLAAPVKA